MKIIVNTTAAETTLITRGQKQVGDIKEILVANTATSNYADVSLRLEIADGTDFYYFKKVIMPVGSSLLLDNDISFDGSKYSLKIDNAGTNPSLSVIIK